MVVKSSSLRKILFYSFEKDARITYDNANGVIGTSEDYTERAFKNRKKDIPAETVYVGCNLSEFDAGVEQYKNEIIKENNQFWVTYAGSISTSYDIKTLIDAGHALERENVHIQILGTGSLKDELEKYSENMKNIHFWGFTPYRKMAAVLYKSDIVVNSFIKGAPQSIVNKVGDYLASGKPMINTLQNPVFCKLIDENNVGINIEPENQEVLSKTINMYLNNKNLLSQGVNARKLAEDKFNRATSYKRIVTLFNSVLNK